jgi:hypothetical protein
VLTAGWFVPFLLGCVLARLRAVLLSPQEKEIARMVSAHAMEPAECGRLNRVVSTAVP